MARWTGWLRARLARTDDVGATAQAEVDACVRAALASGLGRRRWVVVVDAADAGLRASLGGGDGRGPAVVAQGADVLVCPGTVDGRPAEEATWTAWGRRLGRRLGTRRVPTVAGVLVGVAADDLLGRADAEVAVLAERLADRLGRLRLPPDAPVHLVVGQAQALAGMDALTDALDPELRAAPLGRCLPSPSIDPVVDVRRAVTAVADGLLAVVQGAARGARTPSARADLLALPTEVADLSAPLGALAATLAAHGVALAGLWWATGHASAARRGPTALAAALGVAATRRSPPATGDGPAFAARLVPAVLGAVAPPPSLRPALLGASLALVVVGLALFAVTRGALDRLDGWTVQLGRLDAIAVAAAERPDADRWRPVAEVAAALGRQARPERFGAAAARWLPGTATAVGAVDRALRAANRDALVPALADRVLADAQAAVTGLDGLDPRGTRAGPEDAAAMKLARDTHALVAAWRGLGSVPAGGCAPASVDDLARRLVATRRDPDPVVDVDRVVAGWWPEVAAPSAPVLDRLATRVAQLPPEVVALHALLAQVAATTPASSPADGLDASAWRVQARDWTPDGLDAAGCLAVQEGLRTWDACGLAEADPAAVFRRYVDHADDQWRQWWAGLRVADVHEDPDATPSDVAAELRRVLGAGRDLDVVLARLGRGDGDGGACTADDAPAGCCACACARRPWRLAATLGSGGTEAWAAVHAASDALATAIDGVDGPGAEALVQATWRGTGPFVGLHTALQRALGAIVPLTDDLPPGCGCEGAVDTVTEAEVRSRVEAIVTLELARAWDRTLAVHVDGLQRRWADQVVAPWAGLRGSFPLDVGSSADADPVQVAAFLGCDGTLGAFLDAHVRPLLDRDPPGWGRASSLAWAPELTRLVAGFDRACRVADTLDQPRSATFGMAYDRGATDDVAGMRLEIDGQALTYRFGQALPVSSVRRDSVVRVESVMASRRARGTSCAVPTGPWAGWRALVAPMVTATRAAPPYDRGGLAFRLPSGPGCPAGTLGAHRLTLRESGDGPAAAVWALQAVVLPTRLVAVDRPS
ncbi:MAG: hypothetical protein H6733_06745 [Alphaproteobacteria bacterium]|nr:hypothetical protein [Alphaproteobacteria bacterium]